MCLEIAFPQCCLCLTYKRKNNQFNIHKTNVKSVYFQHVRSRFFHQPPPSLCIFTAFSLHVWWFWMFFHETHFIQIDRVGKCFDKRRAENERTCHKFDCEPNKANSYRIYFWWDNAKEATDLKNIQRFFWWLLKRMVS